LATNYILYAPDGAVLQFVQYDEEMAQTAIPVLLEGLPEGSAAMQIGELPGSTQDLFLATYVDAGILRSRVPVEAVVSKRTIAADGVDQSEITGLPIPCNVAISGAIAVASFVLSDGVLDITSDTVGDILVSVNAGPPWLSWSTTISAT
jgi:hypothetical protein